MRGAPDDQEHPASAGHLARPPALPSPSEQVSTLFRQVRLSPAADLPALVSELESLAAELEAGTDAEALLQALHARLWAVHHSGARLEHSLEAADDLRAAAAARREGVWTAVGHACRGLIRVEAGQAGAALPDLAEAELQVGGATVGAATSAPGERVAPFLLMDTLARAYARLRLPERSAFLREEATRLPEGHRADDEAEFRAAWAADLAVQALEPLAMGTGVPDPAVLSRAEQVGAALGRMPSEVVGERLGRGQDAVRALAAAYHGQPTAALRLLGRNAFGEARDLPPLQRQIATLAAMKAHVLVGSLASARSLDEAASATPAPTVHVVLDICRARERAWLEAHAGGDVQPVLHRLSALLVRLSWQALDLVADTARQALEQHATREESRTDALTGVGNRRALDEELRHLLRFAALPLSLVLVDVDHFKHVNDAFTHVVGDEVLRRVATALAGQLRTGDRLLRYGGDEFVVLLPETGDAEAHRVAQRMTQAVADVDWAAVHDDLAVSVTSGCAALWSLTGRRPDADAERLFRRADEALLEAKRSRTATPEPTPDAASPSSPPAPAAPAPAAPAPAAPAPPPLAPAPSTAPFGPSASSTAPSLPSAAETTGWTLTPAHGTAPVPAPAPQRPTSPALPPTSPALPPSGSAHATPAATPPGGLPRRPRRHAAPDDSVTDYVAGRRLAAGPTAPAEPADPTPSTTVIDLRGLPSRRERLRPRPQQRSAANAFEDPVPEE
ncbi:MAG: diguanylate cyclase [Kineosporiaceae bacterium]